MIFVIQTNDEIAGLDIDRALSLAGIQHTILSKQKDLAAQQEETMNPEENLLIAKNLLRLIEQLQAAGRRSDIVGVIANQFDVKDRKNAQKLDDFWWCQECNTSHTGKCPNDTASV